MPGHQVQPQYQWPSVGLGLRRDMLDELCLSVPKEVQFFELAPENWLSLPQRFTDKLAQLGQQYPIFCHGLSLSLGGVEPLDVDFIKRIKAFLDLHHIDVYSEHLSYCFGGGHLHELLPLPFIDEAIEHVAVRLKQVEDILQRPVIIENVSYYGMPAAQMTEIDFINGVLEQANCQLLLDINNVHVNAINHGYDGKDFLAQIPTEKIAYLHLGGHHMSHSEGENQLLDTHGAKVCQSVWQLLADCYASHGVFATLLERDNHIPMMDELVVELAQIHDLQKVHGYQKTHGFKNT